MNEWERIYSIIGRIEEGKYVSQKERDPIKGVAKQGHLQAHAGLFAQYVIPRDRKYGSNPGAPASWDGNGSFFDVSISTIRSVTFRNSKCAEVVTDWGYMLPGGSTMFVMKHRDDRWLIDGLKTKLGGKWESAHL